MPLTLSLIIPTRERATYLQHSIRTCTANPDPKLEILVLDNASTDNTTDVVAGIHDPRIRYVRNELRLSMRNNFEKGLELARGDIICFIGDDDGIFPDAVAKALQIFEREDVDALSAARAHYFWPDLLTGRRNMALLPRNSGIEILDSKVMLEKLLSHGDYYRLPCLYHGFVRRNIVERIRQRQGRFFLSSQVDMFSSIAISMEGIKYVFSKAPFVINGGSSRSNGASHFGGGTDQEKVLWKKEDELGFLPGFDDYLTVGSLIIESALRYCQGNPSANFFSMLNRELIWRALNLEASTRVRVRQDKTEIGRMFESAFMTPSSDISADSSSIWSSINTRAVGLIRAFAATRPIGMKEMGVVDVFGAAQRLNLILQHGKAGFAANPLAQFKAALKLAHR